MRTLGDAWFAMLRAALGEVPPQPRAARAWSAWSRQCASRRGRYRLRSGVLPLPPDSNSA